jgi:hypothetical protein
MKSRFRYIDRTELPVPIIMAFDAMISFFYKLVDASANKVKRGIGLGGGVKLII